MASKANNQTNDLGLTSVQNRAAQLLREGSVIFTYERGSTLRMETEFGKNPYIWVGNKWKPISLTINH